MGVPHSPRLNSHQEHQPQLCDCNSKPKSSCLVNLDPVVDVPLPVQLLLKDKLHPNRPDQQPPPPTLHQQHAQTLQPLLLQLNNSKAPLVVACWETSPAAQQPQQNAVAAQGNEASQNSWGQRSCEVDAKQFTKCLDENQGNMQICGWYLEQLKACQQAASQY